MGQSRVIYSLAIEAEKHLIIPDFEGLVAPKFLPNLTPLAASARNR